jgi:hypothetical protein
VYHDHPRIPRKVLSQSRRNSAPELPIQQAMADRFADVLRQNVALAVAIGDRAGDAQDSVVGPGRDGMGSTSNSPVKTATSCAKRSSWITSIPSMTTAFAAIALESKMSL